MAARIVASRIVASRIVAARIMASRIMDCNNNSIQVMLQEFYISCSCHQCVPAEKGENLLYLILLTTSSDEIKYRLSETNASGVQKQGLTPSQIKP